MAQKARQVGTTIGECLVWITLILAAVVLIITGNGKWVIAVVILAFFFA